MASQQYNKNYILKNLSSKTRNEFLAKFRKLDKVKAEAFCLTILNLIKEVIGNDNIDTLSNLTWLLHNIESIKSENDLQSYLDRDQIGNFNLVALACQKKAIKILEYLFSDKGNFLYKLTVNICESDRLLSDNDEFSHNAFYYAIRSNLVGLFNILVDKWCEVENSVQLEDVISKEYKELKLRRVYLTNEMELYVHNKILDFHFFQDNANSSKGSGNTWSHIKQRIELVHRDIDFLKTHYWDTDPDDKFLLKAEFVAKNIHVLKSLLKSTYDRLPWEEIEFILVIFIRCFKNRSQTNLVYNSVLNKKKVLSYLESFSFALDHEQRNLKTFDVLELAKAIEQAKSMRDKVIKKITKNYSCFQELYTDYGRVRDYYSLETVKFYVDLAVTVDVTEKEGQLVVIRALQVMGEHLKNTLESPKLSDSTAKLLLNTLPLGTRDVITKLRDSLSHEFEDENFIRTVIEKKPHFFFKNIQSDISKIDAFITNFIYNYKTIAIQKIMIEFGSCEHLIDFKDNFGPSQLPISLFFDEIMDNYSDIFLERDIGQLEELLSCLSSVTKNKTLYEKELYEEINSIIRNEKEKFFTVRESFAYNIVCLKSIFLASQTVKTNRMNRYILYMALKPIFENLKQYKDPVAPAEPLIKITEKKIKKILDIAISRMEMNYHTYSIILRIGQLMKFQLTNIKWIKEFKGATYRKKKSEIRVISDLSLPKITILQKILTDNDLVGHSLFNNISFFESNLELQTVIEMLVLDILTVSKDSCSHNPFFLDSELSLPIGKNLRNHLAHTNALINVLSDKNPMQLLLNAIKITNEGFSKDSRKIGKITLCDLSKLKNTHSEHLLIVDKQQEFFNALENGDMEKVQDCFRKGADIYGKDVNEMNCLHFSAKAPTTEAIKFVLQQGLDVASKNLRDETALHIAVKYDRIKIVKYLMKRKLLSINECDIDGKTPLHIAAENGRNDIFKYLLKYETDITIKDNSGLSLLHTAILRRNEEMTEILLRKGGNLKKDVSTGGFTVLHRAAEEGQISLVNMLINMKVDVECKTDFHDTPLHKAAENGHLEVVKYLILNSADVNARNIVDDTPLHCAVRSADKEIVQLLLNHKAEINASMLNYYLPLSFAAEDGHIEIAELLLKHDAVVNVKTNCGPSPLHLASAIGHLEFVKLLLNHGALINQKNENKDNRTALHYSSRNGHLEVVKLLIETGADIEAKDFNASTPLHVAVKNEHYEVTKILIAEGADIHSKDALGSTALHIAAYYKNEGIVQLLLSKGADIRAEDKNKTTPIHILVSNVLSEILIKCKASINFVDAYGFNALHLSAFNGNFEFVRYCLENGCNINERNGSGLTALHLAVQGNNQDVVNYLIDNGAKADIKDNNGRTALMIAAQNNCQRITRILIRKIAFDRDDLIDSLRSSVLEGNHDIVIILLQKCTFDVQELQEKHEFLYNAVVHDHLNVVKVLLEKKFDVNAERKGTIITSLHAAILHDRLEIAQLLLLKGANPNAQDQCGSTPLHYAAVIGNIELV
ncbi:ankyrin-3, partial [Nephila pilipes]